MIKFQHEFLNKNNNSKEEVLVLNLKEGEEEAVRWMNVAGRGGSVTLDDIVNSILDAYVNSSRKLL